jgi:microcystin-dependent protein
MNRIKRQICSSVTITLIVGCFLVALPGRVVAGPEPYVGEIVMFAGSFPPRDWAFCQGQLLQIQDNQTLYSIIGTTYGGDGRITFALPDLRGRVPIGPGTGLGLTSRIRGLQGGHERLVTNDIPAHTHPVSGTVKTYSLEGNSATPANNYPAKSGNGRPDYLDVDKTNLDSTYAQGSVEGTAASNGNGTADSNMQPFAVINYIIALEGIYPPRS